MSRIGVHHENASTSPSWRKWEDPIVYRRPWTEDVLFWGLCWVLGMVVGAVAVTA